MSDKNFRVANSCANCKHFTSNLAYGGGRKKNGYCMVDATSHTVPGAQFGGSWEFFVAVYRGISLDEFISKFRGYRQWDEKNLERIYSKLQEAAAFWKENRFLIHTCHQENTCDKYEAGRKSIAARHIKKSTLDWLEELENG